MLRIAVLENRRCSIEDSQKLHFSVLTAFPLINRSRGKYKGKKCCWAGEGREKWIYFPLKAFVMRDKHIILALPKLFCALYSGLFKRRSHYLCLLWNKTDVRTQRSTNKVRKMMVRWRQMGLIAYGGVKITPPAAHLEHNHSFGAFTQFYISVRFAFHFQTASNIKYHKVTQRKTKLKC